jgi:hypothetical protein
VDSQFSSLHRPGTASTDRQRTRRRNPFLYIFAALFLVAAQVLALSGSATAVEEGSLEASPLAAVPSQSLDGSGNNIANPTWGQANRPYSRVAAARYADGRSQAFGGPNSRRVSNRVHQDIAQNVFSERQVTQWGFVWGQFLDHTFGLREGRLATDPDGEVANIPFNSADPLERFENDLGVIEFVRSFPAPGTGVNNPRQQVNTVDSYIDASAVYGNTTQRLEWMREGSVDNNINNNAARLLLPDNYLPRRDARGNVATAPFMEADGRLRGQPGRARVAGDGRANENIGLTATHTLFAREHNRIVAQLPSWLSQAEKFEIARRVVIAEQQFITYNEFLPAMGVNLPAYTGYKNNVNATLSNEFATVGYRAHSMIHGEFELETDVDRYSQADLDFFESQGLEIAIEGDDAEIAVPLNVAFFNPDLLQRLQLGPMLQGIGLEPQYKNDEQIDDQLRSVLFQIPVPGNPECLDGPTLPECFDGVLDLGAIDIERGRDHGMPTYNQLRQAYGLPAKTSFTSITGEPSSAFPSGTGIDNPNSLDFTSLTDLFGAEVDRNDPDALDADVINFRRRAPLAARLSALYGGNVNNVDAFVGMLAERHESQTDMGELQRAIWAREFTRLRDGDRFFFGNDPGLTSIRNQFGIDFRRNLGDIIASNTDIPRAELAPNVFFDRGFIPPTSCRVTYRIVDQSTNQFQADMSITNTGSVPLNNWALRFTFPNGQVITHLWNGVSEQDGFRVPVTNAPWNAVLNPGQTLTNVGFIASWNGSTNNRPNRFTLNTTQCAIG